MSRIPELVVEDLTPEQRKVWDSIVQGRRGVVLGPTRVWLTSPTFAAKAQELGAYCRFNSSLPPRLSELAILTMGAHWRAKFEWVAHYSEGIKAGLDPAALEEIRCGRRPAFANEDEAAVHAFADELLKKMRVSDATYRRADAALGRRGLVDLVGILGYYSLVSMTLNSFEVDLPAGADDPFP